MIRQGSPDDAQALAALWNPWIKTTTTTFNPTEKTAADLAAMIKDRLAFFVADLADAGGLQGFATYSQFRGGAGYATCMEHTVVLAPAAQGKGIGRALMQAVEAHAKAHGAHQMIAAVSAENTAGRAFHARLGYREIATIPQAGYKFERFLDLVLMQKFLA
jgi:L-amino acid N-acyltransferase YncA